MADLIGPPPGKALDLGSGGGIPGLVLALAWPGVEVALLESRTRCAAFLLEAVETLALADRVEIIEARAEEAAHRPNLRATFALVTSRGFGPPAATAECAVGFLAPGGHLAVSEPPESDADPALRWPGPALAQLNLTPPEFRHAANATVAILTLSALPPATYPRKPNLPRKRPLWTFHVEHPPA
jgi:16S rRNA (guanine527-N7)-methyltransferase